MRAGLCLIASACASLAFTAAGCGDEPPGGQGGDSVDVGECDERNPPAWYRDLDGDGFGNASAVILSCTRPVGYVDNADDCDDGDAGVNPAAVEVCDGRDTSCTGRIDDIDADSGEEPWFRDVDGDGYGDPADQRYACEQPPGYVDNALDCAPGNSALPTAWYREDDTGALDCATEVLACTAPYDDFRMEPVWYLDEDVDGFGVTATAMPACEHPDGPWVLLPGDCDDTNPLVYPGAPAGCGLLDWNCDGTRTEGDPIWYPDCDGDGYAATGVAGIRSCTEPQTTPDCMSWTTRVPTSQSSADCDDSNPDMHPAQMAFFVDAHSPAATGDNLRYGNYDCDGQAQYMFSTSNTSVGGGLGGNGCDLRETGGQVLCVGTSGWTASSAPACGATGQWSTCGGVERCNATLALTCTLGGYLTLVCEGPGERPGDPCFNPTCTPGSSGCPRYYARCGSRRTSNRTMACR